MARSPLPGSGIGLPSLFTIAFVTGMGALFAAMPVKPMREDENT